MFAHLDDAEAARTALGYWNDINLPNLIENVLPTKPPGHPGSCRRAHSRSVERVRLRKL